MEKLNVGQTRQRQNKLCNVKMSGLRLRVRQRRHLDHQRFDHSPSVVISIKSRLGFRRKMADEVGILVTRVRGDELRHGGPVKSLERRLEESLAGKTGGEEPADIAFLVEGMGCIVEDLNENGPLQILPGRNDAGRRPLGLLMTTGAQLGECLGRRTGPLFRGPARKRPGPCGASSGGTGRRPSRRGADSGLGSRR